MLVFNSSLHCRHAIFNKLPCLNLEVLLNLAHLRNDVDALSPLKQCRELLEAFLKLFVSEDLNAVQLTVDLQVVPSDHLPAKVVRTSQLLV